MCDVMDPDRVDNGTIGLILSAIIDGMRADRPNEVSTFLENLSVIAIVKPVTLHSTLLNSSRLRCTVLHCTVLY